jgi:hypothetical protein
LNGRRYFIGGIGFRSLLTELSVGGIGGACHYPVKYYLRALCFSLIKRTYSWTTAEVEARDQISNVS